MSAKPRQPGLFDFDPEPDDAQAAYGRARMREMIEQVKVATVPPWSTEMECILRDGEFKRAMWLVPDAEAQALWAEFDAHMERLYAIWAQSQPAPDP